MSVVRLAHEGYGQIELNNVAWRRDGRIEAQCALSADFAEIGYAENGMLLAVDNVAREIKLPAEGLDLPLAIVYSSEHMSSTEVIFTRLFFMYSRARIIMGLTDARDSSSLYRERLKAISIINARAIDVKFSSANFSL